MNGLKVRFSDHDNDSQVLADIRELLFIREAAGSGHEHDEMVDDFVRRRMEVTPKPASLDRETKPGDVDE